MSHPTHRAIATAIGFLRRRATRLHLGRLLAVPVALLRLIIASIGPAALR